jgi:serine/threonine protein phosphatase PrpC
VVLCSDGLYRSVSDSEIYNIVVSNANDMQKASSELTECALSKNKKYQDNTTVIAIRYM